MPFLAEKTFPIPNRDLLSWIFDEQQFDIDTPVWED
jgi:4-coumarate--CoA ligase